MAVGVVLFHDRNLTVVHIDLLLGKISIAVSLAILGAGFLGALAGGALVVLLKGERKIKSAHAKIK